MRKLVIVVLALLFTLGFIGLSSAAPVQVFLDDPDVPGISWETSMVKTVAMGDNFNLDLWIYDPVEDNVFDEPDDYLFVAWGSAAETNRLLGASILNVTVATGTKGGTWDVASPHKLSDSYPADVIANHWGVACEQPDPGGELDGNFQLGTFHFGPSNGLGTASFDVVEYNRDSDNFQTYGYMDLDPDASSPVAGGLYFNQGTINVIPIPSAVLLLGTGLVGLVAMRRRHR